MSLVNEALHIFGCEFVDEKGALELKERNSKTLILPDSINGQHIKILGNGIFGGKQLETIKLPLHIEVIANYALASNRLKEIVVPRGCTFIGHYAFGDNPYLVRVVLPSSVEFIDDTVFDDTTDPLVLICQEGSYAHEYADNGHNKEILSEEEFNLLYEL